MNIKWDTQQAASYLAQFTPGKGYDAFNKCIKELAGSPGIYLSPQPSGGGEHAVINVRFKPPPIENKKYTIVVEASGEASSELPISLSSSLEFNRNLAFKWQNPSKDFIVIMSVLDGQTSIYTDSLVIPHDVSVFRRERPEPLRSAETKIACGGNRGIVDVQAGGVVELRAPSDQSILSDAYPDTRADGQNGRKPGPDRFQFLVNSPRVVRRFAVCTMSHADERVWVEANIVSKVVDTIISLPKDNGLEMEIKKRN